MSQRPEEKILFLHIPKTGGTTLRHIFEKQYPELGAEERYTVRSRRESARFSDLSEDRRRRIKLLIGHFPYGMHRHFSGQCKYVTFLRDPIKRVLSSYYFCKWDVNNDQHRLINETGLGPVDFICSGAHPWLQNGQVKLIAGIDDLHAPVDETIYRQALDNIDDDFLCTGVLERFDESLICMKHALGWSFPFYEARNITPKQVQGDSLTEEDIARLNEVNRFDLMLYEAVNEKLTERIETIRFFKPQLRILQIGNQLMAIRRKGPSQ